MIDSKPYFCRHCKNPLGLSSDKVLSIGLVKIKQPIKLTCGHCAKQITWRPVIVKQADISLTTLASSLT